MDAVRRIILFAFAGFFSATLAHADIVIGSKRADVIAELGKPSSSARRGAREILQYPKGVRIELEAEMVADIKGYTPPGTPTPTTAKPTPAPPPAPAPAPAAKSAVATPAPAPATVPAKAPVPAVKTSEIPKDLRDAVEEEDEDDKASETSLGVAIGIAAVMLAAQFLLTFAALKIAFHRHQMDALWTGILAITGIDVGLQTLIAVVIYFQDGEVQLGIAGTGLPGLAMIWSIRHFCLDQRWGRAFATTGAVKTASVLLHIGLIMLLAQFGI